MKPRAFPQANCRLLPPPGIDNCDPLETYRAPEGFILSHWQMSAEELDEVNRNGGRLWLYVWSGQSAPPVAIEVADPFARAAK